MSKDKLIELYKKIYYHTKSKCHPPRCKIYDTHMRCCSPEYCQDVIQYAKERWNKDLQITNNKLPLMGSEGCIAEPYLRPMCTVHDCLINNLGFDPDDKEWTIKYFELREQIDELEFELI